MGRAHFSSGRGGRRGGGRGSGGRGGRGRGGGRGGRGRNSHDSASFVNFRDPGYTDGVAKSVSEHAVGIQQFLAPDVAGFHGTVKERYSDFIVREVARDGTLAQLTDVKRFTSARARGKAPKVSELFKQRVFAFLNDATKRGVTSAKATVDATAAANADAAADSNDVAANKMAIPPAVHTLVGKIAGRLLHMLNQRKREHAAALERANIAQLRVRIAAICDDDTAERLERFMLRVLDEQVAATTGPKQQQQTSASSGDLPSAASAVAAGAAADTQTDAFYFPELATKDARAAVHECLRELGENLVVSDTVSDPSDSSTSRIRVRRVTVGGKKRKDMDHRSSRNAWPRDRPEYLQFVLYKRNMETNSVMSQLAKAMQMPLAAFSYAGTKDKRGVTTQFCTVFHGSRERLETLNRAGRDLETFNFVVGNATYVRDKLNLGDLAGNRFALAIRSLPSDTAVPDAVVHAAVASWAANGFVNYFGLQRFGTKSVATHAIGRAILTRDYRAVVDLVLQPQDGDATKIAAARQAFQDDKDIAAALRALPPYLIAERALLQGLQTHGLDAYAQAIQCIPRHLRMMYTHAYQSFVWNMVASDRVSQYARDAPVVGDLVIPHDAALVDDSEFVADDAESSAVALDDAAGIEDAAALAAADNDDTPAPKKRKRDNANSSSATPVVVTAETLAQYSIYDVVLPLPGYDVVYPTNGLRARYDELLRADGVDFDALQRATSSEYHLPGSYRHVLKRPLGVTHEIKRYDDPTIPLLATDVDVLEHKAPQPSIPGAKFRALCLEFQLNPSSYATMAVRELLKQSSNIDVQLKVKEDVERM